MATQHEVSVTTYDGKGKARKEIASHTVTVVIDDTAAAACERYPRLGTEAEVTARAVKAAVIPAQEAIRRKVRAGECKTNEDAQGVLDDWLQGEPTGAMPKWEQALRESCDKAGVTGEAQDMVIAAQRAARKA